LGDEVQIRDYAENALVDSVKSFSYNSGASVNSVQEVYIAGNNSLYPTRHKLNIYNPSIDSSLTIQVLNWSSSLNSYVFLTQVSVPAQPARLNPNKVYYTDVSASTTTDVTTAFTNGTGPVFIPGHASTDVGDILWIGNSVPFNRVFLNIGTPRTDVAAYTYLYSKSDATLGTISKLTDDSNAGSNTGFQDIRFAPPTDWTSIIPNNYSLTALYWLGIQCSGFTSAGNQGQITQGKILTDGNIDAVSKTIQFINEKDLKLIISNNANLGSSQTIAGNGGFTGKLALIRV
jgi:hypothetical protein